MKVLLVDDDEEFSLGLSRLLKKLDIDTVCSHRTSNAEEPSLLVLSTVVDGPSRPGITARSGTYLIYHCWSKCVRGAFLMDKDSETGVDLEYRCAVAALDVPVIQGNVQGVGFEFVLEHFGETVEKCRDVADGHEFQRQAVQTDHELFVIAGELDELVELAAELVVPGPELFDLPFDQ